MEKEELNRIDVASMAIKSALGAVPFAGTFLGEIVTTLIPNQRMDRVINFLNILSEKVIDLEEKCKNSEDLYFLIEEGIRISARVNNEKKRKWIATLIGKGLCEEIEPNLTEKYISILEEISYEQVIVLLYYRTKENHELYPTRSKLEKSYSEVIMPPAHRILDRERRNLCESNYKFNVSYLEKYALLKRTLRFNSRTNFHFSNEYKSNEIEYIIDKYREEIFEKIEKSINETELKITSLGVSFIDNIIIDGENWENVL